MSVVKQVLATRTALTTTGFTTLASATYVASNAYDCSTNQPLDVIIEAEVATTNTPAGNKQVVFFISESLDGTNYRSGPTSGTTTTDEPDLRPIGVVQLNTGTTVHRGMFSVAAALGYVPKTFKIIPKNDLGVALTTGNLYTTEVSATVL